MAETYNIAVDIDEVLCLLHKPFLYYYNETYGTDYVYPDPQKRYYLEEFSGDNSVVAEKKVEAFVTGPRFAELVVPIDGSLEGVDYLKKAGHHLSIITGRQSFYAEVTKAFLDQNFPNIFEAVYYIPHFPGAALSPAEAKLKICAMHDIDTIIDDNLGTTVLAARNGLRTILFGDYHWNQSAELPDGVTRCADWPAVQKYFENT